MSRVMPVEVGVLETLNASAAWRTLVGQGRVYSSEAPEGAPYPYAVLGTTSERDSAVFATTGFDQNKVIDLWSGEVGKELCSQMYALLRSLLHLKPITLSSGQIISGKISLITMFTDPASQSEHAVVHYDVVTRG